MGVGHYQFFSDTLQLTTSYTFIAPKHFTKDTGILYLLHGFSDNETNWLFNTRLTSYAEDVNLLIVMPNAYQSYYSNMVYGLDYLTFLTQELFPSVETLFSLKLTRKKRFICGNSMGGYGALKIGMLTNSFSQVYSLSGAVDIENFWKKELNRKKQFSLTFGSVDEFHESKNDLFHCLKHADTQTKYTLYCGSEDFLLLGNQRFFKSRKGKIKYKFDRKFWRS